MPVAAQSGRLPRPFMRRTVSCRHSRQMHGMQQLPAPALSCLLQSRLEQDSVRVAVWLAGCLAGQPASVLLLLAAAFLSLPLPLAQAESRSHVCVSTRGVNVD